MDSFRIYDGALPWTPEEIQAMLSVWADSTTQKELESSVRNEKVFLRISSELATMGFLRSAKQCREKVKKLKQEYRKFKDHISRGGLDRKGGKWFNLMDSVLGDTRPASTTGGSLLSSSAMAILEAMSSPSPASEDSALTGEEPIVEVQIIGEEQQPIIQEMHEETPPAHSPAVSRANQAVKRKRASCSGDEWKKIIVESDQQYVGALHRMVESESRLRRDELLMKREEMERRRADAQLLRDEASASSAVQGQLVSVLGQIAELFRAKQAAQRTGRGLRVRLHSHGDALTGAALHRAAATESDDENHPRETRSTIKTETEEPVVVQQRTDTAPISVQPVHTHYEESRAHSTTQEAAVITVQQDLLVAQQEQCRLMAENNSIQQRLVRAVSRSNRCMSELAKSIRVQSAAATSVQDRIVQLLERQEWTNQLLTMKIMGVSSTSSRNLQESRGGSSLPSAGPSSASQSLYPGQKDTELSVATSATDQCST